MTTNIADAFDLVGKRWALQVVRELALGPQRYTDLRRRLAGISTNVLAARLLELQQAEIARRRLLPPPAGSAVYELTERGRELGLIVLALDGWGTRTLATATREPIPSWPERTEVEPCPRPIAHRSTASLRQPRGRAPRGVGGNADGPSRSASLCVNGRVVATDHEGWAGARARARQAVDEADRLALTAPDRLGHRGLPLRCE